MVTINVLFQFNLMLRVVLEVARCLPHLRQLPLVFALQITLQTQHLPQGHLHSQPGGRHKFAVIKNAVLLFSIFFTHHPPGVQHEKMSSLLIHSSKTCMPNWQFLTWLATSHSRAKAQMVCNYCFATRTTFQTNSEF